MKFPMTWPEAIIRLILANGFQWVWANRRRLNHVHVFTSEEAKDMNACMNRVNCGYVDCLFVVLP